jgi:hypothetical protein
MIRKLFYVMKDRIGKTIRMGILICISDLKFLQ